ncbi:MAG: hypothetical protein QM477_05990 [Planctomycetota bacterium]
MQRALPLLILAIVLIASLVLFLPESAQNKVSQIDPSGPVSPSTNTLPPAAIPTRAKSEPSRSGLAPQVSKQSAPLPAPVISGAAITLQVWDRATQTPVAFADLYLAPKESDVVDAKRRPGFHDWLEEHAAHYQVDAQGRMQAPRSWLYHYAFAESQNGHWGYLWLKESEFRDTVRIEVLPVRKIEVQVVDAQQAPIPHAFVHLAGSDYAGMQPWRQATTDANGKATFEQIPDQLLGYNNFEAFAFFAGNPPAPNFPPLSSLKDLAQEITLVMPATTTLEVHAFDFNGNPISHLPGLSIRFPGNAPNGKPWSKSRLFQTWVKNYENGVTSVSVPANHAVELGIDFDACGEIEYFPMETLDENLHTVVELHQKISHPLMQFRLLDENGNALGNKNLKASIKADYDSTFGFYSSAVTLSTDALGIGEFRLPHADLHAGKRLIKGRYLSASSINEVGEPVHGRLDLNQPFSKEVHQLGDLVLRTSEKHIFATGFVFDTDGNPLVGTKIDAGAPVHTQDGVGNSTTGRSALARAEVDAQGHFVLYGKRPEDDSKVTLRAIRIGYPWTRVPLLPPGQEHRIVLDLGNIIRGQVLLPLGLEQKGISLEFVPYSDIDAPPHDPYTETSATEGLFRMTELPAEPGVLRVGTGMAWPFRPLATIENVFPWRMGQEGDRRLELLDLRDVLDVYEITAVDENQERLSQAKFSYEMKRPHGTSWRGIPSQNGKAILIAAEPGLDVIILADGYRAQKIVLTETKTTAQLVSALPIHAHLAWMPALSHGREVILSLSPVNGSSSRGLLSENAFDAQGNLQTFASRPGQYHVSLGIQVRFGSSSKSLYDASGQPIQITIAEGKSTQRFELNPPQAFYDELLLPADRAPKED